MAAPGNSDSERSYLLVGGLLSQLVQRESAAGKSLWVNPPATIGTSSTNKCETGLRHRLKVIYLRLPATQLGVGNPFMRHRPKIICIILGLNFVLNFSIHYGIR